MPFLEYLWRSFVGQILVMQWQIRFGFATGESVVMCALKNQRKEKEERQAEDEGIVYFLINIYIIFNSVRYFSGGLLFLWYTYVIYCKEAQHGGIPELDLYDARIEQVDLQIQSLTVLIPTPYLTLTGIYCLDRR